MGILWLLLVCGWCSASRALEIPTGRSRHKPVEVSVEFGARIDLFSPSALTHQQQRFFLGYGGALHRYTGEADCSAPGNVSSVVCDALDALVGSGGGGWKVAAAHGWELSYTAHNKDQLQVQMIPLDSSYRMTGQPYLVPALLGHTYAVTLQHSQRQDSVMKLLLSLDVAGSWNVFRRTVHSSSNSNEKSPTTTTTTTTTTPSIMSMEVDGSGDANVANDAPEVSVKLKVLSYNIWHTNPASWKYPEEQERAARYSERIRHLAAVIVAEDPDIIGLQEVRLDTSFPVGEAISLDGVHNRTGGHGSDAFQLSHLLDALAHHHNAADPSSTAPTYQYVYQPAMIQFDRRRMLERCEEGLVILSKYPIVHTDYTLLPRNLLDKTDDHQRILLHAQVSVPVQADNMLVDVYVSHLSLSEKMRTVSAQTMWNVIAQGRLAPGHVQLLMGDFNAEPHEESVRFLTGQLRSESHQPASDEQQPAQDANFIDTFATIHTTESPQGFTYPTCQLVKRIDYILSRPSSDWKVHVQRSRTVGETPTENTTHLIRDGIGMIDDDSPIWASDHLAILSELLISRS